MRLVLRKSDSVLVIRPAGHVALRDTGGGGGGGAGVSVHNLLSGRTVADTHPMSAITGLVEYLSGPLDEALTIGVDNRIDAKLALVPAVSQNSHFIGANIIITEAMVALFGGTYNKGVSLAFPGPMMPPVQRIVVVPATGDIEFYLADGTATAPYEDVQPRDMVPLFNSVDGSGLFIVGSTDAYLNGFGTGAESANGSVYALVDEPAAGKIILGIAGGGGLTYPIQTQLDNAIFEGDSRLTDARTPTTHGHAQSEVTDLVAALTAKEETANKGVADGYAPLNASSILPSANLAAGTASEGFIPKRVGGVTTWSADATGGGGSSSVIPSYLPFSGDYLSCLGLGGSPSAFTGSANVLYLVPIAIPIDCNVDLIGISVTAALAGKSARLGIYTPGSNQRPLARVQDSGTVSLASVTIQEITISQALAKMQNLYLAVVANATFYLTGVDMMVRAGFTGFGTTATIGFSQAHTFGALPATVTPTAGVSRNPDVRVRLV